MNLEFIELDLDWPPELSLFDLRNYILTNIMEYGEPIRWAITSISNHSENKNQIISVEVVLMINQEKAKGINPLKKIRL